MNMYLRLCTPGKSVLMLLGCLAMFVAVPPFGTAQQAIAPAHLETLVRNAKVIRSSSKFTALASGRQVLVWINRDPKATDDDLKIDAMFIAKPIIERYPNEVKHVKVLYSENGPSERSKCSQVEVTAENVKSFGSHSLTVDQLLQILEITTAKGMSPGPFREKRLELFGRIDNLRKKGTGVKPFETIFEKIGEMARNNINNELPEAIKDLSQKLSSQEQLVNQAGRSAAGMGVASPPVSSISNSNDNTDKFAGQADTADTPSNNSWTPEELADYKKVDDNIAQLRDMGNDVTDLTFRHKQIYDMIRSDSAKARSLADKFWQEVEQQLQKAHAEEGYWPNK